MAIEHSFYPTDAEIGIIHKVCKLLCFELISV